MSSDIKHTIGISIINSKDVELKENYVGGYDTGYSVENSTNVKLEGNIAESTQAIEFFNKIEYAIRDCKLEQNVLDQLLVLNNQMRETSGTHSFIQKYKLFTEMVATHITVLGPSLSHLLPQLVQFLPI